MVSPHVANPEPRRRVRLGRGYLHGAIALAAAPLVLLLAAMLASIFGVTEWSSGFGGFAVTAGGYLALASVVAGLVGLFVALLCGFNILWSRALLALILSAVTVGGFVFVRHEAITRPPVDETVADLTKPA